MIAPDSNTGTGLPSTSWSTMAGMRWLGLMAMNSGVNCSPFEMLTMIGR